jgi:ketosteroid isomerase-like protein
MKRRGCWVVLSLAFSLVVMSGCQKAADDTNRAAAPCPTPETVDTAAIETELLRIENDWPRVVKEKDVEAVKKVEADDGVFVYPDGTIGDKNTDIQDMERGALTADSWELMDLKATVLNKDAGVVSGRSVVKNGKYKTPDGKTIDISGQYRFIDTYARRNGEWKLVAGAATPIRQPVATASPSPASKASPAVAASPAAGASPAITASPATRPVRAPSPRVRVSPVVQPTP